ncbi:MAG: hypothetical protein EOO15_11790 [Chitinophagaceae bacterium]|nr:MAG: hypothetical protein EOO15_11790 [Chitinophagaceae bacterium]
MQRLLRLFLAVMVLSISSRASAQCAAGLNSVQLNWDAQEFLRTTGTYSAYVTAAVAATQKFVFGGQTITIAHNYTGANNGGVNTTHTGETGSISTGADVQFTGNGTITVTFETAVSNVRFSLYDVDVNQRVTFGATNAGTPATISLARLGGSSAGLTITNNNSATARVDANGTAMANNSVNGVVNVTIAGPITSFTMAVTNTGTIGGGSEGGSFWLGDILACTAAAAYTTTYFSVSQPWTNQPGYLLVSANGSVYQVNPANGKAKLIFTDPSGNNINSLAYDPVKHYVYYSYSLTASPATDKSIMRYDYNTGTITTWISNINTLGIPTYESGVESGAAAFYDGKLYLGVEGYNTSGSSGSGRKSIVWEIEIDASGTATSAVQAYAVAADGGTSAAATTTHDWSDIGVNNGIIYDFDGSPSGMDVYQYNMYSGALTRYTPAGAFTPTQVGVDYLGNVYNVGATIQRYNGTTSFVAGTSFAVSASPAIPAGASYGDAAEAFKPMADLGDAPASYDPVANSPAVHEILSTLRLGAGTTSEFTKNTSALATGDADDGMPTPTILINNSNYLTNIVVYNNTGANATVAAWVDFNSNGTFEASEGISQVVPSSASAQTIQLFWPTPTTTLAPYSYTFVRVRVTSTANGMTTSNPTGYYSDGEVEDYRVQVNAFLLPSELFSFDAHKDGSRARIDWVITDEMPGTGYVLQRSADGIRWDELQRAQATAPAQRRNYVAFDQRPFADVTYYRLQIRKPGGQHLWSQVRELRWESNTLFTIRPNPAYGNTRLDIISPAGGKAMLRIYTEAGALVLEQELKLAAGSSSLPLQLPSVLPASAYIVTLDDGRQRQVQRLLLRK